MKTKVIFRKWRNTGDIIALFPQEPANWQGNHCLSYEHVGQHGAASPLITMGSTRLASPEEYAPLMRELQSIGYKLKVGKKFTAQDREIRRKASA